jgi:membrane-associated protease RseP (regulator of RpoE activity)
MSTIVKRISHIITVPSLLVFAGIAAAQGPTPPASPTPPGTSTAAPRAEFPRTAPQPVEPGYLGLVTDEPKSGGKGLRVTEAIAGGPAAQGGLISGDMITTIDGKAVTSTADMGAAIGSLAPGSQVLFGVDRNGQYRQLTVTLGKRPPPGERRFEQFGHVEDETLPPPSSGTSGPEFPKTGGPTPPSSTLPRTGSSGRSSVGPVAPYSAPSGAAPSGAGPTGPTTAGGPRPLPRLGALLDSLGVGAPRRALLGVRTQPVTEETRRRLSLPSTAGALVVARSAGSPAEAAGIPLDAVIVAVNGAPVESPNDLLRLVSQAGPGTQIDVTYLAGGETRQAKVALQETASAAASAPPRNAPLPTAPAPLDDRATPPATDHAASSAADRAEIDSLKHRVQELEQRIDQLERAAKK